MPGQWNPGQCAENGISILTAYIGETETPLQNLCFAFHDLDGDGDRELLIAPTVSNGFVDEMVFEAYDHTAGEIRLIFTGWERNRYYLCMEADGTVAARKFISFASSTPPAVPKLKAMTPRMTTTRMKRTTTEARRCLQLRSPER